LDSANLEDQTENTRNTSVALHFRRGSTAAHLLSHFLEGSRDDPRGVAQSGAAAGEQPLDAIPDCLQLSLDDEQFTGGVVQLAPLLKRRRGSVVQFGVGQLAVITAVAVGGGHRRGEIVVEVEFVRTHGVVKDGRRQQHVVASHLARRANDERGGVGMTTFGVSPRSAPQSLEQRSLGAAEAKQLALVDAVRGRVAVAYEEPAGVGVHADAAAAGDVKEASDEDVRVWLFVKVGGRRKGVAEDEPEEVRGALAFSDACVDGREMYISASELMKPRHTYFFGFFTFSETFFLSEKTQLAEAEESQDGTERFPARERSFSGGEPRCQLGTSADVHSHSSTYTRIKLAKNKMVRRGELKGKKKRARNGRAAGAQHCCCSPALVDVAGSGGRHDGSAGRSGCGKGRGLVVQPRAVGNDLVRPGLRSVCWDVTMMDGSDGSDVSDGSDRRVPGFTHVSGDRLYVRIIEGYSDAKSATTTGVL
jgi:hypothetical protein